MTLFSQFSPRSNFRPMLGMAQFLYLDSTQREVLKAATFANQRFEGHFRSNPQEPEIEHAYRVASIVRNLLQFEEPVYSVVALLHDVLEKSSTDVRLVNSVFGKNVVAEVCALTRPAAGQKATKEESSAAEDKYIAGIFAASEVALAVKTADLIDNLISRSHAGDPKPTLEKAEEFMRALNLHPLSVRMKVAKHMLANTIDQVRA